MPGDGPGVVGGVGVLDGVDFPPVGVPIDVFSGAPVGVEFC